MIWEAYRLTSKSPAEVYGVLGPHGCDQLFKDALAACWRELPEDNRTFVAARRRFFETYTRNFNIWKAVKKPTPQSMFDDLRAHDNVEAMLRQAMVLSWMMMPRAGGRTFADTFKIIQRLYDRTMTAWTEDNDTFTTGPTPARSKKKSAPARKAARTTPKKTAKKSPKQSKRK